MNKVSLNYKFNAVFVKLLFVVCLTTVGWSAQASTPPPTYSLTVSSGSFNPNPLVVDDTKPSPGTVTSTATVSGNVVVTNPNDEYQKNNDDRWSYNAYPSSYSSTKNGSYGSLSGITPPSVSGSSSGTITATANQSTTAGYYQIAITANDQFTVVDSTTKPATTISENPSAAMAVLYLTVVAVGISPAGNVVMVGQGINISVSVQPSDVLPNPVTAGTFLWNVGSYAVGGYQTSDNTQYSSNNPVPGSATYSVGTLIPLKLNTQAINFYWVDNGVKNVSCSIAGLSCSPSVTFNVSRPVGASVQAQPGKVQLHVASDGTYYLQAGGTPNNLGVNFTFTVPATGGSWEWIQLVGSTSRSAVEQNGHTASFNVNSLNGVPSLAVLDTNYNGPIN